MQLFLLVDEELQTSECNLKGTDAPNSISILWEQQYQIWKTKGTLMFHNNPISHMLCQSLKPFNNKLSN